MGRAQQSPTRVGMSRTQDKLVLQIMPNMVREEGDRRMGSMRVSLAFVIRRIPDNEGRWGTSSPNQNEWSIVKGKGKKM
ncbi:hypothetical protein ASPFODRAFT_493889 [Aspergillus luchuensis CBS 106.47]|uniref:Uncharacterized protein n=1 Tax=Aspergillus luchuensis (strain CBS 106.47) TaxID=1137211 RepID=A0A1M3TSD4_ASPLC|nr:hypothetical protein ASPFODRAFT_493889 [Aspergillus luchuensis CBS 106.47]